MIREKFFYFLIFTSLIFPNFLTAQSDWEDITKKARGQTVYFNAWAGSPLINDYIDGFAKRLKEKYNVNLVHVKIGDIAESVARLLAEKSAGNLSEGKIDLMWINGENFWNLKQAGLLYGPFLESLPNSKFIDTENPAIKYDFTLPTEGYEAPWGLSQLVFIYDSKRLKKLPNSAKEFLDYAVRHPGRLTYPQPPDFTGSTFLKQILYEFIGNKQILLKPVDLSKYQAQTADFWNFLNQLTPHLWRKGRKYPTNAIEQQNLLNQNLIDIAYSLAPASASADIIKGDLIESARTYVFSGATIGNTHFVALPFNASAKEGALVAANMLLSAEEQFNKLIPANWGDFTILHIPSLPYIWQVKFDQVDLGKATLKASQLGNILPEPHPSWMEKIEQDWQKRFISQ